MQRDQLISFIQKPELAGAANIPALESLIKDYPWFQTAHLLLVQAMKNEQHIHLQRQIKIAAAHIVNRQVLFRLVNSPETQLTNEPAETSHHQPEATLEDSETFHISSVTQEAPKYQVSIETTAIDLTTSIDTELPEEIVNEPTTNESQPTSSNNNTDALQQEIISTAIEIAAQLELEQLPFINAERKPADSNIAETIITETHVEKPEENPRPTPPVSSFVAWLQDIKSKDQPQEKTIQENQIPNKSPDKLVEIFIEKPVERIKPPAKKEFFKPENMAKQSVTDNDHFVTETLAKIYIKQGNLTKALKVYENLCLTHPEKISTFASQIKKIKEQIQNKTSK